MMMAHDARDLGIVINVSENPLADCGMFLHLAALIEGEGPGLLEQPRRESNLSDVMHEPTQVRKTLLFLDQAHSLSDVLGIDRHSGRMSSRVSVPRVQGRDESGRKRKVRSLQTNVCDREFLSRSALLAIEPIKTVGGKTWSKEEQDRPLTGLAVGVGEHDDRRHVYCEAGDQNGLYRPQKRSV